MAQNFSDKAFVSRKRERESMNDGAEFGTNSPKVKRQFTEQDQNFAEIYDKLADNSPNLRMQAAKDLLQKLSPQEQPSAQLIEKTTTRLIRGLCSGRKAARYGFFVALTELLRQLYGPANKYSLDGLLLVEDLVPLMTRLTKPGSKIAGQERRDYQFGRLYSAKALIQSSILFQHATSFDTWNRILDIVFELATSVPLLREECGMMLVDAVKSVAQAEASEKHVQSCLDKLENNKLVKTPEGVAIWLSVQSTCPNFSQFPTNQWAENDPLHASNRSDLRRAMKDQHSAKQENGSDASSVKSGFWQQSVHFSWEILLQRSFELSSPLQEPTFATDEPNKFKSVWKGLVDDGLFHENSSLERKFWAFQLVSKMLKRAPVWALPLLFQPNLMQNLINSQSNENKMLHEAAVDTLKKIKARVRAEPEIADQMVAGLISRSGTAFFDRITKTKTIEDLMITADSESFCRIIGLFDGFIRNQGGKDQKDAETGRQALGDLLLHAFRGRLKAGLDKRDYKWTKNVLALLVKYAYCKPREGAADSKERKPEVSKDSMRMFQLRLNSCLAYLLPLAIESPSHWPWYTLHHLHSMTRSSKPYQLALDADNDIRKTLKKSYNITKEMESTLSSEAKTSTNEATILLFSMSLLQAYSADTDAAAILGELNDSFGPEAGDQDNQHRYDQVLEGLLSFLSKPSALFRTIAAEVFRATTGDITADGLSSLTAILMHSESLTGQQELFDRDEDVEPSDSEDGIDSDVEVVDASGAAESSDDSEEDSESSDESGPDPEVTEFEMKLAQALKTSHTNDPANGEDEMTDDASMDDEEMLALEPKLEAVFRERRLNASRQKEKEKAKENVINFKRRVLDLITIYVKKEYSNPLSLELIVPLLQLIRTSSEQSLRQKAREVLYNHHDVCQKNKQYPALEATDIAWQLLQDIHQEAQQRTNEKMRTMHSSACSKASLFVVKLLVTLDSSNYDKVVDVYSQTQKSWFVSPKVPIQATFFTEWISWSMAIRKQGNHP